MNTVEGALVLSAIALTAGTLTAGLVTVTTSMAAHSTARDVARIAALGDLEAAKQYAVEAGGQATITRQPLEGTEWWTVTVHYAKKAPLFTVSNDKTILEEPRD